MNCCGQKRQGLEFTSANNASVNETEIKNNLNTTAEQKPVYFKYTSDNELQVKGLFDIIYMFSEHRRQLLVQPEDVSVMRGYADLTEI